MPDVAEQLATGIRPLGDRVLLRAVDPITVTAGGVYLPDIAQEKTNRGVVVAVGPGKASEMTGRAVAMPLEPGDQVLYAKYAGTVVEEHGVEYVVVRFDDVIAAWDGSSDAQVAGLESDLPGT